MARVPPKISARLLQVRLLQAALALCAGLAAWSCTPAPPDGAQSAPNSGPVILAPASTQEVMAAIAAAWSDKGHARPVLSIAGTPALARQAAQGAPADIIITADTLWMDWLEDRGILRSGSRNDLLANGLALVKSPASAGDLAVTDMAARIAIGDPETVPAGRYARRLLQAAGDWSGLAGQIVPTDNVRAALALVERGEVDFAFVYASDLRHHGIDLQIVQIWTDIAGDEIVYPVAILHASRHPDAEALQRFMLSSEATSVFAQHTFRRPGMTAP